MKKPKITEGEWKSLITSDGYSELCAPKHIICNNFTMYADLKACEAVPDMIDALIETRTQLTIAMSHEEPIPTKVLLGWCTQVDETLKKAGCTE